MRKSDSRRNFIKAAGLTGIVGLAGCSGDGDTGTTGNSTGNGQDGESGNGQSEASMEIASAFEPEHVISQSAQLFKEKIEDETDGSFSVTVSAGGAYGAEDEISELVRDGGVEAHAAGPLVYNQYAPQYTFFGNPFVMNDYDHIIRTMDSDLMADAHQQLIDQGNQRQIGIPYYRGIRQYVSDFPVRHPDDIQNVDMRITEIETRVRIWSEIGVNSVPVAWPEVYTALQTGTAETMGAPPGALTSINIHEVKDHLSLTDHNIETGYMYVNDDFYQSLDETYQDLVLEVADEATEEAGQMAQEQEQEHIDTLEEGGMTVVSRDDVEREAFQEAAAPAIESLFEEEWVGTWDEVQSI